MQDRRHGLESQRWQRGLVRLLRAALLLTALAFFAASTDRYRIGSDWTANLSNGVSKASRRVLKGMPKPVLVVAAARPGTFREERAKALLDAYRRAGERFEYRLLDPRQASARARELGVERPGRARVEYDGRVELIPTLTESALTNALYRTAHGKDRWIGAVTGHGERHLRGRANHDLGLFSQLLEKRGFRVREFSPAEAGGIPDNLALLVIASPRTGWLEGEEALVENYLEQGQPLLWLQDPDDRRDVSGAGGERRHGSAGVPGPLPGLWNALGLRWARGVLVSRHAAAFRRLPRHVSLLARYPPHPITEGFERLTLFPGAGPIGMPPAKPAAGSSSFRARVFLESSDQTYLSPVDVDGSSHLEGDANGSGPYPLGIALTRQAGAQTQRVSVLGDADFLSNRYLANQGNLELGLRIIDWLSAPPIAIPTDTSGAPDRSIALHGRALQALAFFAFLGLPGVLAALGGLSWWRRKRL